MRLRRAVRWSAPSFVGACAGALAGGLVDGAGEGASLLRVSVAGFVGLALVPVLFVLAMLARGVWAAWRPREVAGAMNAGRGVATTLGAWIVTAAIALAALAGITFASVYVLAAVTSFRPIVVALALSVVGLAAGVALVLVAVPIARGVAAVLAKIGASTRATIGAIAGAGVVAGAALLVGASHLVGELSLAPIGTIAVAIAASIAVHAMWSRVGRWMIAGPLVGLAVAACGVAIGTRVAAPGDTLGIWADHAISGFVIDTAFDVDRLRGELSVAAFAPAPRPGAPHPDIILVTIDTVRADHTPPYGGKARMPVLAALAERGAVFEWAFSPSNVTRRSIPSMITGLAPDHVKGRVVGWALHLDPRHVVAAERLRAAGYETAGFMCCEGFWGPHVDTGLARGLDHVEIERDGSGLSARANRWLAAREARSGAKKPLFVWIHILEPHNWPDGQGTPTSDEQRNRFYDNVVGACDKMLGTIIEPFAGRPSGAAPIVIVTADHGEGLGDHGQPSHSTDLYDSQTHVPFVMAGAGIPAARIGETVSLTDLAPTLVELAGYAAGPDEFDGRSVADLARGERAANVDGGYAYAAMIKDRSNPGGLEAYILGRWKLIRGHGATELYDTRADPGELDDVASTRPDVARCLDRSLEARALYHGAPVCELGSQ